MSSKKTRYRQLLSTFEWHERRNSILARDNYTCQHCEQQKPDLNVHHRYYIANRLPWDYLDNALVTLCVDCHEQAHQREPMWDSWEDVANVLEIHTNSAQFFADQIELLKDQHTSAAMLLDALTAALHDSDFRDQIKQSIHLQKQMALAAAL